MLSVASVRSAGGAANYFAADNYYTKDQASGEWFGKGAEELGLTGKIDAAQFEALLKGELPDGGRVGREGIHRAGIDLAFSMPKSWSLIALVGGDKRIVEAYTESVKSTLAWAEQNAAQARIQIDGHEKLVPTGNLAIGLFEHDTSRAQEPQAHVHAVVANVTQMPDGEWRALRNDKLWSLNTLFNSMTMAAFREKIEKLGYEVGDRSKHGNFEAAGFTRNAIMAFSTRRQQILEKVSQLSSRSPEAFQAATLMTREDKAPVEDRAALYESWKETAREVGLDLPGVLDAAKQRAEHEPGLAERWHKSLKGVVGYARDLANSFAESLGLRLSDPYLPKSFPDKSPSQIAAACAVASAIRHLEQREAGFARTDVLKAALDTGLPTTIGQVEQAVQRQVQNKDLVVGHDRASTMMTTKGAIKIEQRILDGVDLGRSATNPILNADITAEHLQTLASDKSGIKLNPGQESAGRLLLGSSDRTIVIQGVAGAGKSTLLEPAARLLEQDGRQVIGLAVQNTLVQMLKRDLHIEAQTVYRFLKEYAPVTEDTASPKVIEEAKATLKDSVILVDEASMLPNHDQLKLIEIANKIEIDRLVFVGDKKQLGAVDAGKPFDLVQKSGISTAHMDENIRARTDMVRAAANAAQRGEVDKAMKALGGNIVETDKGAAVAGAEQWLSLPKEERDRTAIFASGRRLRDGVNLEVQKGLLADGRLGKSSVTLSALDRINLTDEQLRYSHEYKPGHVVEFVKSIRTQKLPRGLHTVTRTDWRDRVILRGDDGRERKFKPASVQNKGDNRIALYEPKEKMIHENDKIRWTANDHERGLLNADRAIVTGITKTGVEVETSTGTRLTLPHGDPMLKRIDLAYALNAHMAQGLTADKAIVVMEAQDTKLLTQQNFLVSITRVRDTLTLVVDQKDRVTHKLSLETGEKTSALEVAGNDTAKAEKRREPEIEISKSIDFGMSL
ncbi:MobF family relaxase [Parasphingorhabdus halotolerans]|uniref:Conjugative relaxase n=1 Tax=Parasphingorhabdus halotolerans TaxID=2725558 RepID=A0A6H2DJ68_9SPHN|nr:MobF family relaxase [Parasphingorhabdus halotolerans]QJB68238.1 conjugative relaxase [Parasphingorhabdus halotolerans]